MSVVVDLADDEHRRLVTRVIGAAAPGQRKVLPADGNGGQIELIELLQRTHNRLPPSSFPDDGVATHPTEVSVLGVHGKHLDSPLDVAGSDGVDHAGTDFAGPIGYRKPARPHPHPLLGVCERMLLVLSVELAHRLGQSVPDLHHI
ncbi:MAG TPA: hypothetical protein PLX85_06355, partial [Dehalococcoidia bacterium]|nr:hypothetical protein [Dehalococcoidia bacterium]